MKVASTRETLLSISSSVVSQPRSLRLSLLQSRESSSFFRSRTTLRTFQPIKDTVESATASEELQQSKVSQPSGEVMQPTSSVTSQPRHSTSLARISTRRYLTLTTRRRIQSSSSLETVPPVELLVPRHSASYTLSISQEPVLPPMLDPVEQESSLASSTVSPLSLAETAHRVSTEASESQSSESSPTVPPTSVSSIPARPCSSRTLTSSSSGCTLRSSLYLQEFSLTHSTP